LTGRDRKVHALWNIATALGLEVGVVNWLNTQPPEEISGVMVSDFAIPGERRGREAFGGGFASLGKGGPDASSNHAGEIVTYPTEWMSTVKRMIDEPPLIDHIDNPFENNERLPHRIFLPMLARTFRNDDLVARIALEVESKIRPDILMVYFPGIDRTSHIFWSGYEQVDAYPVGMRLAPDQRVAAAAAIKDYYRFIDALIGELVARFNSDDLVVVLSDHGFEAEHNKGRALTGGHNSDGASHGVMFIRGKGIPARGNTVGINVNDITPTILAYLGKAVAADMDGAPASLLNVMPPTVIASYDTSPIVRVGVSSETTEDAIIEDLRALGYVE